MKKNLKEVIERVGSYSERRKIARGLDIESIHSFDLFPNTGHELLLSDLDYLLEVVKGNGEIAINEVTKTAPAKVYLCVSDDATDSEKPFPAIHGEDLTWAENKAVEVSVEYVRADLIRESISAMAWDMAKASAEK